MMIVGYFMIAAVLWPFVFAYAVLPLAIIFRIYAYFKMVIQICRFRSNYNGQ